eukprot:scaffold26596_cov127-Cylindrotheca_fusiformis.AAC.1
MFADVSRLFREVRMKFSISDMVKTATSLLLLTVLVVSDSNKDDRYTVLVYLILKRGWFKTAGRQSLNS